MLAWAKRAEVQRAQAAVLNMLTESRLFDKINISKSTEDTARAPNGQTMQQQLCRYCGGNTPAEIVPSIWQDMCRVQQDGAFQEGLPQQKKQGDK